MLALLGLGGSTSQAAGQMPAVGVGAAVGVSFQNEGESDSPYLGPGFGGTAPALAVFVDALVTPRFTVGGELTWAQDISGEQSQRVPGGSNIFVSDHHDTVISGTASSTPRATLPSTLLWWAAPALRGATLTASDGYS